MQENSQLSQAQKFFQDGNLDDAEQLLVSLLRGDIKNTEYRNLGERILRAKQEKKHQKMQEERKNNTNNNKTISVQKFLCPNCKSDIDVFSKKSETVSCAKCNAIIDLESDLKAGNLAFSLNSYYKNRPQEMSFLRLGLILTLEKKKWQIIGRTRKKITGKEWESEDNAYTNYTWSFDEWILVSNKKEYLYLSEDKEGFTLSRSFIPKTPKIPDQYASHLNLDGDFLASRITEKGEITTTFVEGEFSWQVKVGDKTYFAENKRKKSVEWKKNSSGNTKEVEFFKTESLDTEKLLNSIEEDSDVSGNIKKIRNKISQQLEKAKNNRFWGKLFFATTGILMLLSLINIGNGQMIFSDSLSVSSSVSTSSISSEENQKLLGPLAFNKKDEIYTISLQSNVSGNNNWNTGYITLLNTQKQVINQLNGEFWSESGYDDEGSWSESESSTELLFYIENPGEYYIALSGESGNVKGSKFSVQVYEGTRLSRYYLWFGIFSAIIGLIIIYSNNRGAILAKARKGLASGARSTSFIGFIIKTIVIGTLAFQFFLIIIAS